MISGGTGYAPTPTLRWGGVGGGGRDPADYCKQQEVISRTVSTYTLYCMMNVSLLLQATQYNSKEDDFLIFSQ